MITMPVDANTPTLIRLRERLREEMSRRQETVRSLGERAGVGYPAISRILNGHNIPRIDTLDAIAQALDIPIERFFIDH